MIDIVIPYKHSKSRKEIHYCLQSIARHLTGVRDIYVIGDNPGVAGIVHIPFSDIAGYAWKEKNIYNKLMIACKDARISENFLYMNDDHFLLQDYYAPDFPVYASQKFGGHGDYQMTVENTRKLVNADNFDSQADVLVNFDVHCPIIVHKETFKNIPVDFNVKWGYCIKTLYSYWEGLRQCTNLRYSLINDLKVTDSSFSVEAIEAQLDGRPWFSTGENIFFSDSMKTVMNKLYAKQIA